MHAQVSSVGMILLNVLLIRMWVGCKGNIFLGVCNKQLRKRGQQESVSEDGSGGMIRPRGTLSQHCLTSQGPETKMHTVWQKGSFSYTYLFVLLRWESRGSITNGKMGFLTSF